MFDQSIINQSINQSINHGLLKVDKLQPDNKW